MMSVVVSMVIPSLALFRKDLHSGDYEGHEGVRANGLPIVKGRSEDLINPMRTGD
jgi:hypothetical protein